MLPKYMLVVLDDEGGHFTSFFEKYIEADNARMDYEVGLGFYVEMYERTETEDGFREYQLI